MSNVFSDVDRPSWEFASAELSAEHEDLRIAYLALRRVVYNEFSTNDNLEDIVFIYGNGTDAEVAVIKRIEEDAEWFEVDDHNHATMSKAEDS